MHSQVFLEDLDDIIADPHIPWEVLRNHTVLITGATGAIGSILVQTLAALNRRLGLGIHILAYGRDADKAQRLFGQMERMTFVKHDIRTPLLVNEPVDYLFHGAAVTKSAEMIANPVNLIETALKGTEHVLKLAKRSTSMVYLSSMEVYGITDPSLPFVSEQDLGYLNLQHPRSSYPESKRMSECMCNCYYAQFGTRVKIARLAQTFGAGFPRDDSRIFAQFARGSMAGTDLVLHTEGHSRGNYCYSSDAIRGLFLLLLRGIDGETYNIVNPDTSMTIREMADLVAKEVNGGNISVLVEKPADREHLGYAPDVTLRMSAKKIKQLGWEPKYGLADMYRRIIADWKDA